MINYLKSFVASSHLFWKFRHTFDKNLKIQKKGNSYYTYFESIIDKLKPDSILDYGCGTADLLYYLKIHYEDIKIMGVDLNKNVISYNKKIFKSFSDKEYIFSKETDGNAINDMKNKLNINNLDLVIFERVLYIMGDRNIDQLLNYLSTCTKRIYIDDFFIPNNYKSLYKHRNWDRILKNHSFLPYENFISPHREMSHANPIAKIYEKK